MINTVVTWIQARMVREDGQDLIEYALLGGVLAAAIMTIVGLAILPGALTSMANEIRDCIDMNGTTVCNAGP